MNDGLIPQRYARALYKYAQETNSTTAVYDEMKNVIDAFEANPSMLKVMENPFVAKSDKEKLLLTAAGDKLEDGFKRFIQLIFQHKREALAYYMALDFRKIYRKENKIAKVVITTAAPITDDLRARLCAMVEKAYKGMTLEFEFKVNPDLIGGFMIDVDSARLDASISNEIEQLRQNLLSK